MPASTLPTKSAPTSAPFVKIPPPNLANIEIKDAPKPKATNALISLCCQCLSLQELNNKSQLIKALNLQLINQL